MLQLPNVSTIAELTRECTVQDLANVLEQTLDLPSILPHGARVDPTSDGFLIWLPTCEPQMPRMSSM